MLRVPEIIDETNHGRQKHLPLTGTLTVMIASVYTKKFSANVVRGITGARMRERRLKRSTSEPS